MAGTSGSTRERCGPVKAMARRRPARICPAVEVPDIIAATSPATVAVVAGAPPLYGTWIMLIPARALRRSMVRWCWLPLPPEPYCRGGLARRAYSMNSVQFCAGTEGLIARKKPFETRLVTGARSFSGATGITLYGCGLITNRPQG